MTCAFILRGFLLIRLVSDQNLRKGTPYKRNVFVGFVGVSREAFLVVVLSGREVCQGKLWCVGENHVAISHLIEYLTFIQATTELCACPAHSTSNLLS